jgi:excisionase family DNA binding protein
MTARRNTTRESVWLPQTSKLPRKGLANRREAARFLRVTLRTIDNWIAQKKLESIKVGRSRLVKCESLWKVAEVGC